MISEQKDKTLVVKTDHGGLRSEISPDGGGHLIVSPELFIEEPVKKIGTRTGRGPT